jgi:DNA helicase HerA-like ATPase
MIRPPSSRVGPIAADERKAVMANSPVGIAYDQIIDRESAFEVLGKKAVKAAPAPEPTPAPPATASPSYQPEPAPPSRYQPEPAPRSSGPPRYRDDAGPPRQRASNRETVGEAVVKSIARNASGQLTRSVTNAIVRGILGSLTKGLR